jgi:hypothetical protein
MDSSQIPKTLPHGDFADDSGCTKAVIPSSFSYTTLRDPQLVSHFMRAHSIRPSSDNLAPFPPTEISPGLMNLPVRSYPLRQVNEPAVYVMGEKAGQKVYPHGMPQGGPIPPGSAPSHQPMPPNVPTGPMSSLPMNMHTQKAMLAQQNTNMEVLERRRERERTGERGPNVGSLRCFFSSRVCTISNVALESRHSGLHLVWTKMNPQMKLIVYQPERWQ